MLFCLATLALGTTVELFNIRGRYENAAVEQSYSIQDSRFEGLTSDFANGGALCISNATKITLNRLFFLDCVAKAPYVAGGIFITSETLDISSVCFDRCGSDASTKIMNAHTSEAANMSYVSFKAGYTYGNPNPSGHIYNMAQGTQRWSSLNGTYNEGCIFGFIYRLTLIPSFIITDSIFTNNTGTQIGCDHNQVDKGDMARCIFVQNKQTNNGCCGIVHTHDASLQVYDSIFINNAASFIFWKNTASGTFFVANCAIHETSPVFPNNIQREGITYVLGETFQLSDFGCFVASYVFSSQQHETIMNMRVLSLFAVLLQW